MTSPTKKQLVQIVGPNVVAYVDAVIAEEFARLDQAVQRADAYLTGAAQLNAVQLADLRAQVNDLSNRLDTDSSYKITRAKVIQLLKDQEGAA